MNQSSNIETASNPTVSDFIEALRDLDGDKVIAPYVARYSPDPNTVINVTDSVVLHVFDDFGSGEGEHHEIARFDIAVAEFIPEPGQPQTTVPEGQPE